MADLASGAPRKSLFKLDLGGETFLIATPDQAKQAGGRAWQVQRMPAQEADPAPEFHIDLSDFSDGAGLSFAQGLFGYSHARGWDASTPKKLATWPRFATLESFTTADSRGWGWQIGTYLYEARGRYVCKYAPQETFGSQWSIIEIHDLGSGNTIAGRPDKLNGKVYVPIRAGTTGALQRFHELTTIATTTAESQTITITGTPTAGSYVLHFDGKDTAAIAFNAPATDVQTALRLVAGLEKVTVTATGTTPNFVHTVVLTGVAGALGAASPPQMTVTDSTSGGTHNIAIATTVAGVSDTWTQGGSSMKFRCFKRWSNKLVGASGNQVFTCATTPTTDGNWAGGYDVGDPGADITDLGSWMHLLVVGKTDGLWTFDDALNTVNELPDLEAVVDPNNCVGMEYTNGYVLVPHKTGLIRWQPGSYEFIGPEQEGWLEGDASRGWGKVTDIASYGRYAFYSVNDLYHVDATFGSLQEPLPGVGVGSYGLPVRHRSPLTPHAHQQSPGGYFEAVTILSTQNQPSTARDMATFVDDSGTGTVTWANPSDASADDGVNATAGVGTTHYLKATNPGNAVPSGATILGVLVEIKRSVGTP